MAPRDRQANALPDREQLLEFIRKNPHASGKREISRAFGLNVGQKRDLKKLLRELQSDGTLRRDKGRKFVEGGKLPAVGVVDIIGPDDDGELIAKPLNWDEEQPPPLIYMVEERKGQPALGRGDRALARLTEMGDGTWSGKTIRRISAAAEHALGVIIDVDGEFRVRPTDRRAKSEMIIRPDDLNGAQPGDLVRAEVTPGKRLGLPHARVTERLDAIGARTSSLIAIHHHNIPIDFPPEAVALADNAKGVGLEGRVDLRDVPLVTIDGADARDFDDAVWAERDSDADNKDGWHLMVAIADVSWYVRPGDALDREAYKRGNSVYFPDRVVPMLPEALSNGWCSLVPNEDRPCMVAEMWINADGTLIRHKFLRGLMRSVARLTYTQAQFARDGQPDDITTPLIETVIAPLYGAYAALNAAKVMRRTLELDLPERQISLADDGTITAINERQRLDSHKLIEEFMITANVAAAKAIEKKQRPCMYRIHDRPSPEKLTMLSEFLASINLHYAKGQVPNAGQFNQILKKAEGTPQIHMVNQMILRSQAQAEYNPRNIGHFGLALQKYCHFTSPIRRYSDLLVHRALISGYRMGDDGLSKDELGKDGLDFAAVGEHLSATERRAAAAERDTVGRFVAEFMAAKIGATFTGRVNGVARFGLFVTLDETGADGLIPISTLPNDYYEHDESHQMLIGRQNGRQYRLGQQLDVRLIEANPMTGGLIFALMETADQATSTPVRGRGGRPRLTPSKKTNRGKRKNTRNR